MVSLSMFRSVAQILRELDLRSMNETGRKSTHISEISGALLKIQYCRQLYGQHPFNDSATVYPLFLPPVFMNETVKHAMSQRLPFSY